MKFQILQENLEKAVSITSRFASTRAQLPILGNILVSANKSKVIFSSTNLEISASVIVGAKIEEDGNISVPSRIIAELVSNLPKETVSLSSEKEQLKVSTSGFSGTILGMNSSDFPKIPTTIEADKSIKLPKKEILEALSQVSFATSLDETRPILTGVLFIREKDELKIVATDGFRLSRKIIKMNEPSDSFKIILPKTILSEISRIGEGEDFIIFNLLEKEKQAIFGIGDTVLTSRMLEGEYPDFEKIIPKSSTINVLLDKEEFLRSVKVASIFAKDAANVVKIKLLKDGVKVYAESSQSGSQETKVEAKIENQESGNLEWEISFNYKFLEDFLHSVKGEEVKMEFSTTTAAGVFTDPMDLNYLHIIMPVRV